MARNAFVIGGGFDLGERAMLEVARVHDYASAPFSIRRPDPVFGVGRFLFPEGFDRNHSEARFRQPAKKLAHFAVHLVSVFAIEVEYLLARRRVIVKSGSERF